MTAMGRWWPEGVESGHKTCEVLAEMEGASVRLALVTALLAASWAGQAQACDVGPFAIEFHSGSAQLTERAKGLLNYEADMLGQTGRNTVRVVFYDVRPVKGSRTSGLRDRQEQAIRHYLASLRVSPKQVSVVTTEATPPTFFEDGRDIRGNVTVELIGSGC